MNINLLDLNNDVLNIIGDSVKKDNVNKMKKYKEIKYESQKGVKEEECKID